MWLATESYLSQNDELSIFENASPDLDMSHKTMVDNMTYD